MIEFDVVVHGATGYAGQEVTRQLVARAPDTHRVAIAGRNRKKLEALAKRYALDDEQIIVADSFDAGALHAMAEWTHVVAACAGPFAKYGTTLVEACVETGTHYCDLTGEPPWVRELLERFSDRAQETGAILVPFAGFDSVPSDLGAYLSAKTLREGEDEHANDVLGVISMPGASFGGGTIATAMNMQQMPGGRRALADPFVLCPELKMPRAVSAQFRETRKIIKDPEGRWCAPFFMAPVNTRVVYRSAMLFKAAGRTYGDDFRYDEVMRAPHAVGAGVILGAIGGTFALAQSGVGRKLIAKVAPAPGEGPSEEQMARGHVRARFFSTGSRGTRRRVQLDVPGDAGYRATALMMVEVALGLATPEDRSPLAEGGGFFTPSTALEDRLMERMIEAGAAFQFG